MLDILQAYIGNDWIFVVVLLVVFYLLSRLLTWIIKGVVHVVVKKTRTNVDDMILERTRNWAVALFFFIAIRIFILPLVNLDILNKINDSIIILLVAAVAVIIIDVLIDTWGRLWASKTKSTLDDALLPLFHKISKVILWLAGIIIILHRWEISITPFLAGAGVIGIVLGFALKDSLANIFGGISLILDKNFQIGDTVKLSSGEMGKILDVGLRSTKIKTFDNELLIIPNNKLSNEIIQNFAKPEPKARVVVPFGVVYGSKPEKVRQVVLKVLKKVENVLDDPKPRVYFSEMADFSLNFNLYFWVSSYKKRFNAKEQATEAIYNALNKAKIGIPFPTSTVYLKKKR